MSLIKICSTFIIAKKNLRKQIIPKKPLFVTSKSISATDHINKNFVFTKNIKTNLSYQFTNLMSCGQSKKFLKYKI